MRIQRSKHHKNSKPGRAHYEYGRDVPAAAVDEQRVARADEVHVGIVIGDAALGVTWRGKHRQRARAVSPVDRLPVLQQDVRLRASSARDARANVWGVLLESAGACDVVSVAMRVEGVDERATHLADHLEIPRHLSLWAMSPAHTANTPSRQMHACTARMRPGSLQADRQAESGPLRARGGITNTSLGTTTRQVAHTPVRGQGR